MASSGGKIPWSWTREHPLVKLLDVYTFFGVVIGLTYRLDFPANLRLIHLILMSYNINALNVERRTRIRAYDLNFNELRLCQNCSEREPIHAFKRYLWRRHLEFLGEQKRSRVEMV